MTRTIKKYANRKLYDTTTSTYLNLTEIMSFIKDGETVSIVDNVTKKDITTQVLLQAIFQKESESTTPKNELLHEVIKRYETLTGAYTRNSLDLG